MSWNGSAFVTMSRALVCSARPQPENTDRRESDLDFVVEFQPAAFEAYADAYFGLLESLERLFGGPVDLVVGSAIRNPYFRQAVEETRTPIYEA